MRAGMPLVAYRVADGLLRRFTSIYDLERKLGIAHSYSNIRKNTGKACKGWLIFDAEKENDPETIAMLQAAMAEIDNYNQVAEERAKATAKADRLVSVRIDSKTVILVKASKVTPDYAERYRAKMRDAQRQAAKYEPTDFVKRNDHMLDHKRGGRQ